MNGNESAGLHSTVNYLQHLLRLLPGARAELPPDELGPDGEAERVGRAGGAAAPPLLHAALARQRAQVRGAGAAEVWRQTAEQVKFEVRGVSPLHLP